MRSFAHWTPAYIYGRLADNIFRSLHPQAPWLTPRAISYLEKELRPDFSGLEYGSGRSTTWFAGLVKHLVSVEHNPEWFARVQAGIKEAGIKNIDYHFFSKPESLSLDTVLQSDYVQAGGNIPENSLDFVLVDGISRPACLLHSIPLMKSGAILILDDANHYLPSTSRAPNSRKPENGPLNDEWKTVEEKLTGWNAYWFGNGVKETAVFHKP